MTYEIVNHIGIIATKGGWSKEVNLVSWNSRPPKIDIRDWNADHSVMKKGITLTKEEAAALAEILKGVDA